MESPPTGGSSAPYQTVGELGTTRHCCAPRELIARSFEMRCTVPVPSPNDLATFKIPTPFASCFRTFRSVALSIFGRPSFTSWATARLRPAFIDPLERRRPCTGRGQVVGVNNATVSRELGARFNSPRVGLPQTSPWLTPRDFGFGRCQQRPPVPLPSFRSDVANAQSQP